MKRLSEVLRSPALMALDARLRDPKWHPTPEKVAEAAAALAVAPKAKQQPLPLRQPNEEVTCTH